MTVEVQALFFHASSYTFCTQKKMAALFLMSEYCKLNLTQMQQPGIAIFMKNNGNRGDEDHMETIRIEMSLSD